MALIPSLTGFVTNPMTEDLDANGQILNDINTYKTAVLETNRLDVLSGSLATEIDLDSSLHIASTKSLDFTGAGEIERGITGHLRLINLPTIGAAATNLLGYNVATNEVESTATSAPTDWSTFPATTAPDVNDRTLQNVRNITGTNISYIFNGPADIQYSRAKIQCGTSELRVNDTTNEILIKGDAITINGEITGANTPVTGWFLGSDAGGNWIWKDPATITVGNALFTSNVNGSVVDNIAFQSGNNVTSFLPPPAQNNCFLAFNQDVTPNRFEWRLPSITQYRTSKMFPNNQFDSTFGNLAQGPGFVPSNLLYYECAVTHPNGYVYTIPYGATRISRLNPETGFSDTAGTFAQSGNAKFACAITASNMKIYIPPYLLNDWLIYDPFTNTEAVIPAATNSYVCISQVGNFLYALATDLTSSYAIQKLDITTLVETNIDSGSGAYWGCCIGVDGRIYYAPYESTDILVLDPTTDTTTTIATGLTASPEMYKSVCLSKTGDLYFAPYSAAQIMKLTPAGVVSFHGTFSGTEKFSGITLGTNDVLHLCPYGYDELVLWDPNTDTQLTSPAAFTGLNALYGVTKWAQLLLLQNGTQMMLVPFGVDINVGGPIITLPTALSIKTGQPVLPPWMLSQNHNKQ